MPYKKGTSGNEAGRPKGSPNRSTDELREMVQQFVENNLSTLQDSFNKLEPKDRLTFFEKMLKHCLPAPMHEYESLSEEQLDELILKLKNEKICHVQRN